MTATDKTVEDTVETVEDTEEDVVEVTTAITAITELTIVSEVSLMRINAKVVILRCTYQFYNTKRERLCVCWNEANFSKAYANLLLIEVDTYDLIMKL